MPAGDYAHEAIATGICFSASRALIAIFETSAAIRVVEPNN